MILTLLRLTAVGGALAFGVVMLPRETPAPPAAPVKAKEDRVERTYVAYPSKPVKVSNVIGPSPFATPPRKEVQGPPFIRVSLPPPDKPESPPPPAAKPARDVPTAVAAYCARPGKGPKSWIRIKGVRFWCE